MNSASSLTKQERGPAAVLPGQAEEAQSGHGGHAALREETRGAMCAPTSPTHDESERNPVASTAARRLGRI